LKLSKWIALVVFGCALACSNTEKQPAQQDSPKGRVITPEAQLSFIDTEGNTLSTIDIAIADEPLERNQGLMDVRTMGADEGMLFIFEEERPLSFWMANTPLSLDIMYVNSDSTIVRIYSYTTPFSEATLPSDAPAIYVVETNAGYAVSKGITEGMKIRF
jgi:hypothetical protein